jgi:serine/threonine protein kinase
MQAYVGRVHHDIIEIVHTETSEVTRIEVRDIIIKKYIGTGANALVFQGLDAIGRDVAIKVYPPRVRQEQNLEELREKAISEVRKLAQLKQTGFPTIYSLSRSSSGWPIVVMEYGGRRSIRDQRSQILAKGPIYRALILGGVFEVLRHAEEADILHGDVHFGNVLVDDDIFAGAHNSALKRSLPSRIEVIDFGTSMLAGRRQSAARHARLLKDFTYKLLPELAEWCRPSARLNSRTGAEMLPRLRAALHFYLSVELDNRDTVSAYGMTPLARRTPPNLGIHIPRLTDFDLASTFHQLAERFEGEMQTAKREAIRWLESNEGRTSVSLSSSALDQRFIELVRKRGAVIDDATREAIIAAT